LRAQGARPFARSAGGLSGTLGVPEQQRSERR
jgi:hypothetical protein